MKISYFIGTPVGLMAILMVFFIPVWLTGEGLATMAIAGTYGKAIIGLTLSFLVALGIGGHLASLDFQKGKALIKTSFKYSLTINSIIWTVFIVLTIIDNYEYDYVWTLLVLPMVAFFVCTALTTFTLGLLVCSFIREKIENMKEWKKHSW